MQLKENKTFFDGTYAKLVSYFFDPKILKYLKTFKIETSQFYD